MSFVQQAEGANPTAGTSIAAGSITTTLGHRLIVAAGYFNAAQQTITITDSQGNTWNSIGTQFYDGTDDWGMQWFETTVTTAGATVVTATYGASSSFRCVAVYQDDNAAGVVDNDGDWNRQVNPGAATDAVVSASTTNSAQPARQIGFCFDYNANVIGAAGTGFTGRATLWAAFGAACARFEDRDLTTVASQTATFTAGTGTSTFYTGSVIILQSVPAPVLSAPLPSGVLITSSTATVQASTNQASGTGYAVVDTAANLAGVTAAEIIAGQRAGGAAALASGNAAISASPFTVGVSGLTGGETYSYAVVQNNVNGDSNIVTGTFTTAFALASVILWSTTIPTGNDVWLRDPTATAAGGITAVAADSVTFGDSAEATTTSVAVATDTVAFTDSAVATATLVAAATDTVAFTDSAVAAVTLPATAADSVTFTDSAVAALGGITADAADTVAFTDSAVASSTLVATATDTVTFGDSAEATTTSVAVATDTVAFTDSAVALATLVVVATDTVAFTDSAVAVFVPPGSLTAVAADSVTFSDSAAAVRVPGTQPSPTSTPGRKQPPDEPRRPLYLRAQIRGETEEAKRLRRIAQGIEPAPAPPVEAQPTVRKALQHLRAKRVEEANAAAAKFIAELRQRTQDAETAVAFYREAIAREQEATARAELDELLHAALDTLEAEQVQVRRRTREFDIVFIGALLASL